MSGTHRLSYTPEYRAWQTMRLRCTNPRNRAWKDYGGRGITICDAWLSDPAAFIAHIGPKPSPKHELDRIDNSRGYEPGNVRWATRKENCRNRRSNVRLTLDGQTRSLVEWCEHYGVPRDTARKRLVNGWPADAAVSVKPRHKNPNGAGRRDGRRANLIGDVELLRRVA